MTNLDGNQVGTVQGAAVNEVDHAQREGLNTFDLSHYNALTARFADITPVLCMETTPRDSVKFSSNHELRTLTLGSPLLSPVRMHKSYFHVPVKAIMPNTWDLLEVNPKKGQDIPDDALPKANLYRLEKRILNSLIELCRRWYRMDSSIRNITINELKLLAVARNFFSEGGLLRMLGYPVFWNAKYNSDALQEFPESFDAAFNDFITGIFSADEYDGTMHKLIFNLDNNQDGWYNYKLNTVNYPSGLPFIGPDGVPAFFDALETGGYLNFWNDSSDEPFTFTVDAQTGLRHDGPAMSAIARFLNILEVVNNNLDYCYMGRPEDMTVNLCSAIGYHMAVAQFFSNDDVDNVDSARVWLNNFLVPILPFVQTGFYVNSVKYYFDCVAAAVWNNVSMALNEDSFLDLMLNLCCLEQSLKYGDYFNGSRTSPLAVGDVQIQVNTDETQNLYVEAIDVTKSLAKQRFLNAVKKLSSGLAQYAKGMFGISAGALDPAPQFVARSISYLGNPETVNTASEQGVTTSTLVSNDGNYEFTAQFQDFGYLYGFISFDVIPCYPHVTDRQVFHRDRFEYFNSMLQNIGDQEVRMVELDVNNVTAFPRFAYQQRYAEYKQGINRCSGGFSLADHSERGQYYGIANWLYQAGSTPTPIDSGFIRHRRCDFDRFYASMDGIALATNVHFAILLNQQIRANRAMQFQSTLL